MQICCCYTITLFAFNKTVFHSFLSKYSIIRLIHKFNLCHIPIVALLVFYLKSKLKLFHHYNFHILTHGALKIGTFYLEYLNSIFSWTKRRSVFWRSKALQKLKDKFIFQNLPCELIICKNMQIIVNNNNARILSFKLIFRN